MIPNTKKTAKQIIKKLCGALRPIEKIPTIEWARKYRGLSAKSSAKPGKYNPDLTPWIKGMLDAFDDENVKKIVCKKSAQVAWTEGVILNYIARRIDNEPAPMIVMFAKEEAAKAFNSEKFIPMIDATPRLQSLMPGYNKAGAKDQRWAHKNFPGGFLKFVGSNSPTSAKSTSSPIVLIEEPDDCARTAQGDMITILEERAKTYQYRKVAYGGTPTIDGMSRVDSAYNESDKRKFYVPCHHCESAHVLSWENLKWNTDDNIMHDVYGGAIPESTLYFCPDCGGSWTELERDRNVRRAESKGFGWKATADFNGIAGFYINELYSPFAGSKFPDLVKKFLSANHALKHGDDSKMRSFVNNTLGNVYGFTQSSSTIDDMKKNALSYEEFTVPSGGLEIRAGVDVQHDRLAIVIRAWGRGEVSYLVYAGEIYGQTSAYGYGAWIEFEQLIDREFQRHGGGALKIKGGTIDSSDGQTNDAVYAFVRKNKFWLAGKGSSFDNGDREIFTPPKIVDYNSTREKTKAQKSGVKVYSIGTIKAKDIILGGGIAKGRACMNNGAVMYSYDSVRSDYFSQVIDSELKIPSGARGKLRYVKKSGQANEFLDCEVMALHNARFAKIHIRSDEAWDFIENALSKNTEKKENSLDNFWQ